jgi:predicted hydrocarbon binding protein
MKLTQEDYVRDASRGLKIIGGMNMVIHCHHYNARLQNTIEGSKQIDGKSILRESAAIVYENILTKLKTEKESGTNLELASNLYQFLGFGILDFSKISEGIVVSPSSHYVEGWQCGSIKKSGPVCTIAEGFIEGALKAILGTNVSVKEIQCLNEEGCEKCIFEVISIETEKYDFSLKNFAGFSFENKKSDDEVKSNIDKSLIIETVLNMGLEGNNEGLIPAFNVYLAHTPQDFYNLVCIKFIREMDNCNLGLIAKEMLVEDAEHCALNTFGGILDSDEWTALIQPMVKEKSDEIFGLVAVANSLGWGRISVSKHVPFEELELSSFNGYEAYGYIQFLEFASSPQCFMLKGVTAGLMELVYEKGELEDRAGKYVVEECSCLTNEDDHCHFKAEAS